MSYTSIVLSSGHGKYVRGASGIIDEVEEARYVVNRLANELRNRGVDVVTFHDDTSYDQNTNLKTIVNAHNSQNRQLDISVHFNAYEQVSKPMGCEVLYLTQPDLAAKVSQTISDYGELINRGAKKRDDLYFLNNTEMPSILLEVCFVDSEADCVAYRDHFDQICAAIADVLVNDDDDEEEEIEAPIPPVPGVVVKRTGKVSWFGGPKDGGVSEDEGLAFIYDVDDAPHLFLPYQPQGTTGLARRLNPFVHYIACRWNYDLVSKAQLLKEVALVRNTKTGVALKAFPSDWGPHNSTERIADISPGLMDDLGLETDDEVEVTFPYTE